MFGSAIPVRACLQPPRHHKKTKAVPARPQPRLKKAIDQAMSLCKGFEDTVECRIAWDLVDDLSKGRPMRDDEEDDELACREYDV